MVIARLVTIASLILAGVDSQYDARQPHTVHWQDKFHGKCSLQYTVRNEDTKCSLALKHSCEAGWTSQRTDTHSNDLWAEIKLAIPIRVKGSQAPQLLVKLYRPNWLDYVLYAADSGSVEKVFSFSCRDESAIKWVASKGELRRFVTFDRFEPVPDSLTRKLPTGTRLQLRQEWRYNRHLGTWTVANKRWVRYAFGEPVGNPVIAKPSDCRFLYPH